MSSWLFPHWTTVRNSILGRAYPFNPDRRLISAVCITCSILYFSFAYLFSTPAPSPYKLPIATASPPVFTFQTTPVLLVSAFFPLPSSKHSPEEYASWLAHFLGQVVTPLVIFTTKNFSSTIQGLRGDLPLIIDTRFDTPFQTQPLRGLEDAYNLQHSTLDREKHRHSASLYATWNSKAWFLNEAATRYAGNSTKWFFWCDAGALRERHKFAHWPDVQRLETIFQGAEARSSKVEDLLFIPIFDAPISTHQTRQWSVDDGPLDLDMMSEGSFFGGQLPSIRWWSKTFYSLHDRYLSKNQFVGKDQNIFNSILFLHPSRIITVWPRDPLSRLEESSPEIKLNIIPTPQCTWDPWYYFVYWLASASERYEMRIWMTQQYQALPVFERFLATLGLRVGKAGRGECRIARSWLFSEVLQETVGR